MFCPKCGKEVLGDSKFCSSCGAEISVTKQEAKQIQSESKAQPAEISKKTKSKTKNGIIALVIVLLFAAYYYLKDKIFPSSSTTSESSYSSSSTTQSYIPVLEVQNWSFNKTSDSYGEIVGQVKNITNVNLENVSCLASIFDQNGKFITSEETLIDYQVLLPGQLSPFHVMVSWNPEMKSASIEFKELLGGRKFIHKVKPQK